MQVKNKLRRLASWYVTNPKLRTLKDSWFVTAPAIAVSIAYPWVTGEPELTAWPLHLAGGTFAGSLIYSGLNLKKHLGKVQSAIYTNLAALATASVSWEVFENVALSPNRPNVMYVEPALEQIIDVGLVLFGGALAIFLDHLNDKYANQSSSQTR